jgi:hypothetical protein
MRALVVGLLVLAAALGAFAQSPMEKALAKTDNETPKVPAALTDPNPALPESAPSVVMSDPATRAEYLTAMQRFYEYRANGDAYRSRVFEWQLLSSRVIFVIVLVLVIAGIYFAAAQFRAQSKPFVRVEIGACGIRIRELSGRNRWLSCGQRRRRVEDAALKCQSRMASVEGSMAPNEGYGSEMPEPDCFRVGSDDAVLAMRL